MHFHNNPTEHVHDFTEDTTDDENLTPDAPDGAAQSASPSTALIHCPHDVWSIGIVCVLGTDEVYQELCPDPKAETLKVPVDSDCADDKETRKSCSGEDSFSMDAQCSLWHVHRRREHSQAQQPTSRISSEGSGATEGLGAVQLLRYHSAKNHHRFHGSVFFFSN